MILIVAAMELEYEALESIMENVKKDSIYGVNYSTGLLNGKEVALILSGIGKVNAAYTVTTMFSVLPIYLVINIGSAGGINLNDSLKVGDIIVGEAVCYHDVDITFGGKRQHGEIPNLPRYFKSNLNNSMRKALDDFDTKVHYGVIASGDQFIQDYDLLALKLDYFENIRAVEMEACAIAHCCYLRGIKFVVFRSISDVVNDANNHVQFDQYIKLASQNSARAVSLIVDTL